MRITDDISIYLPRFLSSESTRVLFDCLKDFPHSIDERFYTSFLKEQDLIYQGDGIKNMLVINIPDPQIRPAPSIILSNTCDIDPNNIRPFQTNVLYSPIFNLKKYLEKLKSTSSKTTNYIDDHIKAIKRQEVTQIFYLPSLRNQIDESIVFLDRVCNCPNDILERESILNDKIFTLSDYGAYLFLLKLSIHFTRIQDRVERRHGGFRA